MTARRPAVAPSPGGPPPGAAPPEPAPPEPAPPATDAGLPAGTRLVLAAGTRRILPGLLTGGAPWRMLRLTEAGDRWVDRWATGTPVPDAAGARRLARRLVDSGMAWTRPAPDPDRDVTVVVPARNRAPGLAATLAAVGGDAAVVVVDDASTDGGATGRAALGRPGTELVRRVRRGGPGAARNTGWRHPVAPGGGSRPGPPDGRLVAFLDTECIPPEGWLAALAGHFADPAVGAVAPRVAALPAGRGGGRLDAYDRARSPLDLGAEPGPVRPRARVPYVPTAALVVRRSALDGIGGFDETLTTGEDVDLVWRLVRAGWSVRYDPSVVVGHPVRAEARSWLRQRYGYGRSAAPLAARHGPAVAPLVVARAGAATWALAAAGHPLAGVAVAAATGARLGRDGATAALPRAELTRLVGRGQLLAGLGMADALRRAWWPLAALGALRSGRARRALAAAVVVAPLVEWVRRRPALDPVTWTVLRLADDLAYGAGVWAGAARAGSARCLVPVLI